MKNITKVTIGTIILISLIAICTFTIGIRSFLKTAASYQHSIYDDDSKIASDANSYSYFNKSSITQNDVTQLKFKLTGVDTLYELNSKDNATVNIDYNCNISNGKFKIVLVSPDKNITTIIDKSCSESKEIPITSGKSKLKIIGDDAEVQLQVSISSKDNVSIRYNNN